MVRIISPWGNVHYDELIHFLRMLERKLHRSFPTHRVTDNMSCRYVVLRHEIQQIPGENMVIEFFGMRRFAMVPLVYYPYLVLRAKLRSQCMPVIQHAEQPMQNN